MINVRTSRIMLRFLCALAQIAACGVALLLLTAVMVIVQAQRDETRPADIALVLNSAISPPMQAQLDAALVLHRRGIVSRILLAGDDTTNASRYLTQQGTPAEAVLVSEPGSTLPQQIAHASTTARLHGANSVVVVGERWGMLRMLKIARDNGLVAYGTLTSASTEPRSIIDTPSAIVRESWAYLGYLFGGR
jgi:vancomycin permeability regulator SanA